MIHNDVTQIFDVDNENPRSLAGAYDSLSSRINSPLFAAAVVGSVIVGACGVLAFLAGPSPPLPSFTTQEGSKPTASTVFFDANEVAYNVPLAPLTYPENLQGIVWLDQQGFYGTTSVSSSAADIAMSFGDTEFSELNQESREILVSASGPAWTWLNTGKGYSDYANFARKRNFLFQWNSDYSEARIWTSVHQADRNWFGIGPTLFSLGDYVTQHWMTRQQPALGTICPPPMSSSNDDHSACAKWKVTSCWLGCFGSWIGINKPAVYYAFQIVDREGNNLQPYQREFIKFVQRNWSPDENIAASFGIDFSTTAFHVDTIFHGEVSEASTDSV